MRTWFTNIERICCGVFLLSMSARLVSDASRAPELPYVGENIAKDTAAQTSQRNWGLLTAFTLYVEPIESLRLCGKEICKLWSRFENIFDSAWLVVEVGRGYTNESSVIDWGIQSRIPISATFRIVSKGWNPSYIWTSHSRLPSGLKFSSPQPKSLTNPLVHFKASEGLPKFWSKISLFPLVTKCSFYSLRCRDYSSWSGVIPCGPLSARAYNPLLRTDRLVEISLFAPLASSESLYRTW